jgi:mannose/fructose/N-acetylgalactosamine-specific phosphotransferase system component IIC
LFLKALLVSIWAFWIGSSLTLNTRFFAFSRPLVNGFVIGLILGDPVKGTIIGAMINAVYIGVISVGGSTPANTMLAGTLGTALGILADMEPEVALAFAIPVAVSSTSLNVLKMSLFSFFTHWADRYAEEGNMGGIVRLSIIPGTIFAMLDPGLITFLAIYYGAGPIESLIAALPQSIISALTVAGKVMPAVGYALLLRYMAQDLSILPAFFIGFVLATYLHLDIMAVVILGACVVLLMHWKREGRAA